MMPHTHGPRYTHHKIDIHMEKPPYSQNDQKVNAQTSKAVGRIDRKGFRFDEDFLHSGWNR